MHILFARVKLITIYFPVICIDGIVTCSWDPDTAIDDI
jgi:hypothetical protein